jgi:hypothetical protein
MRLWGRWGNYILILDLPRHILVLGVGETKLIVRSELKTCRTT